MEILNYASKPPKLRGSRSLPARQRETSRSVTLRTTARSRIAIAKIGRARKTEMQTYAFFAEITARAKRCIQVTFLKMPKGTQRAQFSARTHVLCVRRLGTNLTPSSTAQRTKTLQNSNNNSQAKRFEVRTVFYMQKSADDMITPRLNSLPKQPGTTKPGQIKLKQKQRHCINCRHPRKDYSLKHRASEMVN